MTARPFGRRANVMGPLVALSVLLAIVCGPSAAIFVNGPGALGYAEAAGDAHLDVGVPAGRDLGEERETAHSNGGVARKLPAVCQGTDDPAGHDRRGQPVTPDETDE